MAASRNRLLNSFFTSQLQAGFQQRAGLRESEQSCRRLLEGRVMGNFFQSDYASQIRTVVQQRRDLSIVATQMFLQSKDGEDLMLSKRLRAARMGIHWQRVLCDEQSDQQYLPW
jgi:hypothetical protein